MCGFPAPFAFALPYLILSNKHFSHSTPSTVYRTALTDDLFDLTDGEVKEVLVESLKLAGVPSLHIARMLKALNHHRSSTLTDHVDEPVFSTNSLLNNPRNGTNTVDDVSTTITDNDLDLDHDLDLVQAVATPQLLNEQELGITRGSIEIPMGSWIQKIRMKIGATFYNARKVRCDYSIFLVNCNAHFYYFTKF